jgi:hypothetical protein
VYVYVLPQWFVSLYLTLPALLLADALLLALSLSTDASPSLLLAPLWPV